MYICGKRIGIKGGGGLGKYKATRFHKFKGIWAVDSPSSFTPPYYVLTCKVRECLIGFPVTKVDKIIVILSCKD